MSIEASPLGGVVESAADAAASAAGRSVPDAIVATVIADIRAGRYGVGDRLPPERDLATSAGVSRGSVREALAELARRGIIERRQGRGSTVISGGNGANLADRIRAAGSDLQNTTELRDIVEPRIAALAAFRARDDDLAHLVRLMEGAPAELSLESSLELDVAFHRALAEASGNPLLLTLCDVTSEWTREHRSRSHSSLHGRVVSWRGHREILDAVLARDSTRAAEAMGRHLREVRDVVALLDLELLEP